MEKHNLKYRLLADLLATLKAEEFDIGIGKHLNLQELLAKLPDDIEPEEMKTLLCPIFAKNKQDQSFFYDLFNQSLVRAKAKTWSEKKIEKEEIPETEKLAWWIKILAGLLLTSIIAGLLLIKENSDPPQMPDAYRHTFPVEFDSSYTFSLQEFYLKKDSTQTILTDTSTILYVSFLDGQNFIVDSTFGTYQIDSLGRFTLNTLDSTTVSNSEITVVAKYYLGFDTTVFNPYLVDNEPVRDVDEGPEEESEPDTLAVKSHPFPKSLANFFPPQPTPWKVFFNKYYIPIKTFLALLLLALFGLWHRWYKARNQQIIADIQSKTDPPLLWNIEIPNVGKLGLNEDYFQVLNQMRQRTNDDHFVLSLPKTIDKTIEQGGVVNFQYQYKTRPPEYLLLIDRQSSKNHRAHLYDYIYQNFKANEVYIERFFYEGDIRMCWNEYYPNGVKLTELQQSYRESRLIIIGSGYQMLNPTTGRLAKWTRYFDGWEDKAILSPRPTQQWGGRERQLQQKFIMLPASMQSLSVMVDKMEAIDPDEIKTKISDDINEPIEFRGDLIGTLHHYFSIKKDGKIVNDRMVQWIAACAIYPTLHWDLSMFLGQELSDEDHDILTVDNVIQLTRLPWFIDGKIPEQARLELLEYLPNETELHLRKSMQQLFDTTNLPDSSSVAYSDARMNIALNEYLLEKNPRLKKEYEQYLRAGTEADVTMLKYLDGEKSPKDFEVDQNWRKFAQGEPVDILPDRLTKILSIGVLGLIMGLMFYFPSIENCNGELIQFGENELCIETPRERLVLREFQIREKLKNMNSELFYEDLFEIDSIENFAIAEFYLDEIFKGNKDTLDVQKVLSKMSNPNQNIIPLMDKDTSVIHFYNNIAIDFYNEGVLSYNEFQTSGYTELNETYCKLFDVAIYYEGQISPSQITRELTPIVSYYCNSDGDGEEQFILTEKVGGRVFDQETNKRIEGVEVTFFGRKNKTSSRGRYLFDVPTDSKEIIFPITFKKEGYQDLSKSISRSTMETFLVQQEQKIDLEDVFLKKKENGESCFEKYYSRAKEFLNTKAFSKAASNIDAARICDDKTDINNKQLRSLEQELKRALQADNIFVDSRDYQLYKIIKIGNQNWFGDNLNLNVSGSVCYDEDPRNCEKYGKLYNTKDVKGLCPEGWRVPKIEDFFYLFSKNGMTEFELDGDAFVNEKEAEQLYDKLSPGGPSNFNWANSGVGEVATGGRNKFSLFGTVGALITDSYLGDDRFFFVIGKDEQAQMVLTENRKPGRDFVSCRCVKGPKPDPTLFESKTPNQNSQSNPPPSGNKMTLEIEVLDKKTKKEVPGFKLRILEDNSISISTNGSSGHRFRAEVEEGKRYTIVGDAIGYNQIRQLIYSKAEPIRQSQKIVLNVNKSDDNYSIHPSLFPYRKSILAYYLFDGNANDVMNKNNSLELNEVKSQDGRNGKPYGSYYFDGDQAHIKLPKIIPTMSKNYSISFWIKTLKEEGIIFGQFTQSSKNYIGTNHMVSLQKNKFLTINLDEYPPTGGGRTDSNGTIPRNRWTHVVVIRNQDNEEYYINGKLVWNGTETEQFSTEWGDSKYSMIGNRPKRGGGFYPKSAFNGWLDDLIIFDKAIDKKAVQVLYKLK